MAARAAPVYGLSSLPEGLNLAGRDLFQVRKPKAPAVQKALGVESWPATAQQSSAVVQSEGVQEDVDVDGKFGPLVHKVGGNSDWVRMGVPAPGFQRKWWFESSSTEREVSLLQAAKTNRSRRDLEPPEPGFMPEISRGIPERLAMGAHSTPEMPTVAEPSNTPSAPASTAHVFKADTDAPQAPPEGRPFDIVVYGATGFTGCLIAQHLDAILAEPKRAAKHSWALAGRSLDRLLVMAGRCKSNPSVISASTPEEIVQMVASCRVLIAAAGPFSACGGEVVAACVEHGTHYVDVTGELSFVQSMAEGYHEIARSKGVMVIHCAGQIATVDDINCYLLAKRLGPLSWFREYWNTLDGVTGGTFTTNIATMAQMGDPDAAAALKNPFSLGGQRKVGTRPEDEDPVDAEQDQLVFPGAWLQPTYNSRVGSRVVRRTCGLFEEMPPEDGLAYGDALCVRIMEPAPSQKAAQKATEDMRLPESPEAVEFVVSMMKGQQERGEAPPAGQGPPPQLRSRHWSEIYAVAESEKGAVAHVHYTGPQSYEVTAMTASCAALTILEEPRAVKPEERGGVLTPAFALHGSSFLERLQARSFANGTGRRMKFDVVPGKPKAELLKQGMSLRMREFAVLSGELAAGALRRWEPPTLLA